MTTTTARVEVLTAEIRDLAAALALWKTRDDNRAQPEIRQAANTAMDAIDAMLAEIYQLLGAARP